MTKRPNVVVILTDDQGYGELSGTGNPWIKTPHLDRLAKQSVDLTNFHVSPLCAPTRAALMTGCHCRRVGVWGTNFGANLPNPEVPTVAEIFAGAGYVTGIFGKWHLGDCYPFRPMDRGFQESLVHGDGAVTTIGDHWGNKYFDDTYVHNGVKQAYKGYCTDVWFSEALRFIREAQDKPFFCYLATNAPHSPHIVEERYAAPYRNEHIPSPAFYGMIANIDENVGRFLGRLEEWDLSDNTIVVFMTDNGSGGGVRFAEGSDIKVAQGYNAGMRGCKGSPYDGGHRVPCFIRWPAGGLRHGTQTDGLTAHIDIVPTLLGCCGIEAKEEWQFDGQSLLPLLQGEENVLRNRTIVESFKRTVLTDQWRLVQNRELYDIIADPQQRHDLAGERPEIVKELRGVLEEYRACEDWTTYRIRIGNDRQNPMPLCVEQWDDTGFFWQYEVGKGVMIQGSWKVFVEREGDYRISLRRWPREVSAPISAALSEKDFCYGMDESKNHELNVVSAVLKLDGKTHFMEVTPEMHEAVFDVHLEAGPLDITTVFEDAFAGVQHRSAYFAYVERM